MKRAKVEEGSNSMDRISELPQGILQRILSFLPQVKAVQTSVLSKSWRYIWCTRPNLVLSDENFKGNKEEFLYVAKSSLQRYRDQKLCLDEFRLSISLGSNLYHESISFLEEWIPLLTTMGVKEFRLTIRNEHQGCVTLPPVVFGAESSLHYLHVAGFLLDKKAIERIVLCKHLRSLSLVRVSIEDEIFQKIIASCPLIETMHVERCERLKTIFPHPSLETITIICGNISFHKGTDFHNLSHLTLVYATLSLDHLSSCKFPSLKHLEISNCDGFEETKLFIDAPKINQFVYRESFIPSISFATTSSEWKSSIYLSYEHRNDAPSLWFLKLKELLESLSQSEISLTFVEFRTNDVIQKQERCCGKPVVERMTLCWHLFSISSLINGAFSICRPRIISEYNIGWEREKIECLWKILMQKEIGDLEEVRLEIYDKNREEGQSITLSELQKYKEAACRRCRFVLKWRG